MREGANNLTPRMENMEKESVNAGKDTHCLCMNDKRLQCENTLLRNKINLLEERLDRFERKSRQDNLRVYGIAHTESESGQDCERQIHDVFYRVMGCEKEMPLQQAMRAGCAIIVRFVNIQDRHWILSNAKRLKGTQFSVREDVSPLVRQKQKGLLPLYKNFRQQKKRANIYYDKLVTSEGVFIYDLNCREVVRVDVGISDKRGLSPFLEMTDNFHGNVLKAPSKAALSTHSQQFGPHADNFRPTVNLPHENRKTPVSTTVNDCSAVASDGTLHGESDITRVMSPLSNPDSIDTCDEISLDSGMCTLTTSMTSLPSYIAVFQDGHHAVHSCPQYEKGVSHSGALAIQSDKDCSHSASVVSQDDKDGARTTLVANQCTVLNSRGIENKNISHASFCFECLKRRFEGNKRCSQPEKHSIGYSNGVKSCAGDQKQQGSQRSAEVTKVNTSWDQVSETETRDAPLLAENGGGPLQGIGHGEHSSNGHTEDPVVNRPSEGGGTTEERKLFEISRNDSASNSDTCRNTEDSRISVTAPELPIHEEKTARRRVKERRRSASSSDVRSDGNQLGTRVSTDETRGRTAKYPKHGQRSDTALANGDIMNPKDTRRLDGSQIKHIRYSPQNKLRPVERQSVTFSKTIKKSNGSKSTREAGRDVGWHRSGGQWQYCHKRTTEDAGQHPANKGASKVNLDEAVLPCSPVVNGNPAPSVAKGEGETGAQEQDHISRKLTEMKDSILQPIKEDLSEWITRIIGVDITPDTFIEVLDSGVVLCTVSKLIEKHAQEYAKQGKLTESLPDFRLRCNSRAKSGTWFSRDNVTNFLGWCRAYGMTDETMFDSEDLVSHKEEKPVVNCVLELARIGWRYGIEPPNIIRMEREIEELEPPPYVPSPPPPPPPPVVQKPVDPPVEIKKPPKIELHKEVKRLAHKCKCQEYVNKISEGVYDVFGKRVFIRLLHGKHLMVRVGGGWDTFENYLLHHDPIQVYEFRRSDSQDNLRDNFDGYLVIRSKYKSS